MRSMLLEEKWLPALADVVEQRPGLPRRADVLERVTGFAVHRGALASMHRWPLPSAGELLGRARRVVILEDVNNHTNVGAIFRGAAALGIDAVLLDPRCADPLYRRSVRVSMGAAFAVPGPARPRGPRGSRRRDAGFTVLALTPDPAATPLASAPRGTACCGAAGRRGGGLAPKLAASRSPGPHPHGARVDSLNVAAAAAVAFYALVTKRLTT